MGLRCTRGKNVDNQQEFVVVGDCRTPRTPGNGMLRWSLLLAAVLGGLANAAEAQSQRPHDPELTDHVRGSIHRLQTMDDSSTRDMRLDPQRDREIQKLLPHFRVTGQGTSDRATREQALKRLKTLQMTPSGRQTADRVVGDLSLFRQVPEVRFEMDPDTYDYFLGHPDVVVSMWESLGISGIVLREVKPYQYRMDNPDGTACDIYYLRRSKEANVIYCEGEFKSPFLRKPIAATGVVCLYSKVEPQRDGTTFVKHQADAFIAFPNTAVETAAKLISPVSNYIADRNFQEISLFMHTISLTMARHPGWMQEQLKQMRGVGPEQSTELLKLTEKAHEAHIQRATAHWQDAPNVTR